MPDVSIAVEGDLDEAVLRKVLKCVGIQVARPFVMGGKDRLRKNLARYNKAAQFAPWVAMTDLNDDAPCAPALVAALLPTRNTGFQLRIAVRAIETWLMADRSEIARFLKVPENRISHAPEELLKPKKVLMDLAGKSEVRDIREDMVPRTGSGSSQGPGYVTRMIEFSVRKWSPTRAGRAAPSLRRALQALSKWKKL